MEESLGRRFAACFMQAVDDAQMPDDPDFRTALRTYIGAAVTDVMAYSPAGSRVPVELPVPHWSWNGPE
jgi:hemoglobin